MLIRRPDPNHVSVEIKYDLVGGVSKNVDVEVKYVINDDVFKTNNCAGDIISVTSGNTPTSSGKTIIWNYKYNIINTVNLKIMLTPKMFINGGQNSGFSAFSSNIELSNEILMTVNFIGEKDNVWNRIPNSKNGIDNNHLYAFIEENGNIELTCSSIVSNTSSDIASVKWFIIDPIDNKIKAEGPYHTNLCDIVYSGDNATLQRNIYFGIDMNSDNILQQLEMVDRNLNCKVTSISELTYTNSYTELFAESAAARIPYPMAQTFLAHFLGYDVLGSDWYPVYSDLGTNYTDEFSHDNPSFTHNAGEIFNDSGVATVRIIEWNDPEITYALGSSIAMRDYINDRLSSKSDEIHNYFQQNPSSTSYLFNWHFDQNIVFGKADYLQLDEKDFYLAIHGSEIPDLRMEVLVEKNENGDLSISNLYLNGYLYDLYDFNYADGGVPQLAAVLQLGWEFDRRTPINAGRVFANKIYLDLSYSGGWPHYEF